MDNDHGLELHELILSGNCLALAKIFDVYGENIIRVLRLEFPEQAKQDESNILEATNEALWGYYNNPNSFDPAKKSLKNFLILAAKRDMINLLSRNKKYQAEINFPLNVENEENFWNSIHIETKSSDEEIIEKESVVIIDNELKKYFENERDIELARMVLRGERQTEVFANLLEIDTIDNKKRQEEVKRNKDRIKKVLERNQIESKLKKLLQ